MIVSGRDALLRGPLPDMGVQRTSGGALPFLWRYFLSFSRKCLRNFWIFGATTARQYGWLGLRA